MRDRPTAAPVETPPPPPTPPLTGKRIAKLWWPLAASWALMGAEGPMFAAFAARMADPEVNLAAFASLVFPVSLVVEAPIIMLLAASTALATDWDAYRKLRRFMILAGSVLTLLHVLVAFTPLYYFVAEKLLHCHEDVIEPGRIGLQIMTPWTFAIAYRRFQQGVLIRFEHSRAVGVGTLVRLVVNASILCAGYLHGGFTGVVVGASAISVAVTAEAIFAGICVQPVLRAMPRRGPDGSDPLTRKSFLHFYIPLAMTPLITLVIQPIGFAAMNRMPERLSSAAAWPAVYGFVFLLRSVGFAFNEVVVTLAGEPSAARALRRFAFILAGITVTILAIVAATPIAPLWFGEVTGLSPELTGVAQISIAIAVLMPGYAVLQSWYQGVLVQSRRTRGITEAVALYLLVNVALLAAGVAWGQMQGIYFALATFTVGGILQTAWLAWRAHPRLQELEAVDKQR